MNETIEKKFDEMGARARIRPLQPRDSWRSRDVLTGWPRLDVLQDRKGEYFDSKAKREDPRWMLVDVKLEKKTRLMPLEEMRTYPELSRMITLKPGNRLSITPVQPDEWRAVLSLLQA